MRSFRHWNTTYVRDRIAETWFRRHNPDLPWLTPDAIRILDSWLRPSDAGIEWGSGRSTRWIGQRVHALLSIEHDPGWYARVNGALPPSVDLRHYAVTDPHDVRCSYVSVADSFEDGSLDFSLVDGFTELRDACAEAVLPKLRPGGMLVVDNANWFVPHRSRSPQTAVRPFSARWERLTSLLADWRCIWTTNGVTDTAMWIKPTSRANFDCPPALGRAPD